MQPKCLKCKGRGFCGKQYCPILANSEARFEVKKMLPGKEFSGDSPAPFIGHHGYPYLNVGVLSLNGSRQDSWAYDAPRYWAKKGLEIPEIVGFRSSLFNFRFRAHAQDTGRMMETVKEVGLSCLPVDLEINLKDKPKFRLNVDSYTAPTGPSAQANKLSIINNPSVHTKVDKVNSDDDLKANDAMLYLYQNKFDENFLSKILSVGSIGMRKDRKLVPTRWSITAVDDNVGKHLIERIRDYNDSDNMAFFGGYLGNYYLVLMFSSNWSYELFEMYLPKASWNQSKEISYATDYESFNGRKQYAENTGGGYYAARLALLEKLDRMKRSSSVLVLRFVTGEYAVPLGVWVCREAMRKALEKKPIVFSDKDLMLNYAKLFVKKKFGYDLESLLKQSRLYDELKSQSKLSQFF